MNSIFFPLMFKLGYTKAKVANIVLFFIFFFGLPILVNNAVSNSNINFPPFISNLFKNQSSETMFLGMIIFALVILFLSFMLSIKLYKKREF
jgi:ABC-2 type transport system permease protein